MKVLSLLLLPKVGLLLLLLLKEWRLLWLLLLHVGRLLLLNWSISHLWMDLQVAFAIIAPFEERLVAAKATK